MTIPPFTKPPQSSDERARKVYKNWREGFVIPLLVGSLVLGLLALIPALGITQSNAISPFFSVANVISTIFIGAYVLAGIVTFIQFPYWVRVGSVLLIVYMFGLIELATHGILGDGIFFFLGLIVVATMMFAPRNGTGAIALSLLTYAVMGVLMLSGTLMTFDIHASPSNIWNWIGAAALTSIFGVFVVLGFQRLERALAEAERQVGLTLNELRDERNNLETRVQDRTRQLKRVNEIGRTVTAILETDKLVAGAVFLIGNEFDSYFTAIYFVDATNQWAELADATGDAGKVLTENRHRIDLNGKSAVAVAIRTRQIRIALDSGPGAVRFDSPLLPYTRSQVVAPLVVGDRAIGALELQSTKGSAFSEQELDAYLSLANQIAIAIENSRLFQEAEVSLSELRATQRQYVAGAWSALISQQPLEYELGDDESGNRNVKIPLTLRDQIIGQIDLATDEEWTPEQRNLIETIATQAALALENARLVEESQSIASREKMANDIISKVWSSSTIDAILQTTVRELGRALEAAEVDIEVKMDGRRE